MNAKHTIALRFTELGGDPRIDALLRNAALEVVDCARLRDLLKRLRKSPVKLVVADYHHQRNFSMQRSNVDALFPVLESLERPVRLVLLCLPEDRPHLDEALRQGPAARLQPLVIPVPASDTDLQRFRECIA